MWLGRLTTSKKGGRTYKKQKIGSMMAKTNLQKFNEQMLKKNFKKCMDDPVKFVVWMAGREYEKKLRKKDLK